MTTPIPAGTHNTTVNITTEEYRVLTDAANAAGMRLGQFIKECYLRGVAQMNEAAASQIKAIREERLRMKHGIACLIVGVFSIFGAENIRAVRVMRPVGRNVAGMRVLRFREVV
jgi:hypothetical protein